MEDKQAWWGGIYTWTLRQEGSQCNLKNKNVFIDVCIFKISAFEVILGLVDHFKYCFEEFLVKIVILVLEQNSQDMLNE